MPADSTLLQQSPIALAAMAQAFRSLSDDGFSLLDAFTQSEAERAKRLTAAEPLLIKAVGEDDPQVRELRLDRDSSLHFAQGVAATLKRVRQWPLPKSGELALFGQVVTAKGAPVQGMFAQLSGPTTQNPKRIGNASTNEFGDFALLVPVAELQVPTGQVADWQIVVLNPTGAGATRSVSFDPSGDLIYFILIQLNP